MGGINLVTIFLTGLLAGGLSCLAVQGGLLTATIAQRGEEKLKEGLKNGNTALPIVSFLITKLIAYTLLGFLLGWLGSFFQLSISLKVILQIAVAVFMIGTALSILNVHPIFRYFIIQPPKFMTRIVRKQSKSKDIFGSNNFICLYSWNVSFVFYTWLFYGQTWRSLQGKVYEISSVCNYYSCINYFK